MPIKPLVQTSFFTPEFADPSCLERGKLPWLLRELADALTPDWLFSDWHGRGCRGRDAWPVQVLIAAMVMRAQDGGMSRRAMARRLKTDIAWRAAAGLDIGAPSPCESVFRRFEKYLLRRDPGTGTPRYLLLHEHIVRLCLDADVVGQREVWAMDSTPMWCFGAVRGTVRLLGDGLRGLCKLWAQATGVTLTEVAEQLSVPWLAAKSTKGHFNIDWKDTTARASVMDNVARTVIRVVDALRRRMLEVRASKRKRLLRRCRHLLKVVRDDLETDEDGRLVVAHGVAKGRIVSITDSQARHSRKTKSRPFNGHRLHVVGEVISGLITAVTVTPGNMGDGRPAHRLIHRAKQLHLELDRVLGDTAYGAAELHLLARTCDGVDVLAPMPAPPPRPDSIPATEFTVDLEEGKATCPVGVTVSLKKGSKHRYFRWSKRDCDVCPLRLKCFSARSSSRTVLLHEHHEELCMLRERWKDPEVREDYRTRSQCERLIHTVVRRGCRQARAWGLQAATLQAHTAAVSSNLALLARVLAQRDAEPARQAA